ncbi:MAG TPA: cobalamin biosynthesis protein CobD [Desulfobacteraceae bacterium]|nr:cobalamin biosynthesis protein CobD [Desulfobacteraceae bacterium]
MADISWQIVAAAVALDLLAGDPRWLPHPIIWMGNAISRVEPAARRMISDPFRAGLVFAVGLIAAVWGISAAAIALAAAIHPLFAVGIQILMLFYCFSARSLAGAAMDVARPLVAGDLSCARTMVGYIVGRETRELDREGITRAAVETVAENFVDGFLSPLCFALVFGVPGAMAYKMINTLDSMVGYKNDTYILFGRAAARIDDMANLIPARLSVPLIALAAGLLSPRRGKQALFTALTQGRNHKSPNAGFPEAAFAGALEVRMGGPNVYHGKRVEKPYIGGAFGEPEPEKIGQACDLMLLAALLGALIAGLLLFFLG